MPRLRTLTFKSQHTVAREALTRTQITEYDYFNHVFNLAQRPAYRFTLQVGPLNKSEVECLSALHAYHQGGTPFFWSGGDYGVVENYNLVGEGDGNQRQFYLPNRYIDIDSLAVRTLRPSTGATSNWTTGYSLNPGPGVITFYNSINTIPRSGDDVQARYACQYNVYFAPSGILVEEIAAGIYEAELVLLENVLISPEFIIQVFTPAILQSFGAGLRMAAALSTLISRALFGQTAKTSGAIAASITHNAGSVAVLTMVPGWNTTWWVTSKGLNAAEVSFSTEVGSGGNFVYWGAFF